jgi:RNA polymerase sigma-70 factor (ECF subfamily)
MKLESETRSDLDLAHEAKNGDVTAFEELVRRYTQRMFRIAFHITKCPEDAEEVVQDVFVKAFGKLDRFEERSQFSTWLTRIAINTALMKVRATSQCRTVSLSQDASNDPNAIREQVPDWKPNPEQLYSRSELKHILIKALESLPDHYRTIFVLRDIEGFSILEAAEMLELSTTAVKARLTRARLQLRESLDRYFQHTERNRQIAKHRQTGLSVESPLAHSVELWMEVATACPLIPN